MDNAGNYPCEVFYKPDCLKFNEDLRIFQGCPTLAVTKKGRIYAGWYAGGLREPHMDNYNCLVYSDNGGETWSNLLLVIPSSYELMIHALDIQLFTDENGTLHVCWVQNNVRYIPDELPEITGLKPRVTVDGFLFDDFRHCEWEVVCNNPDETNPAFSEPRKLYYGFLRCKPLRLADGNLIAFNYSQLSENYIYSISSDGGKTYTGYEGAKKLATMFDESMAYQMENGTIRMFARTMSGELAVSDSYDGGYSWTETVLSGIIAANSRFYVKKLPSGRVLLILNADRKIRTNMTLMLSEDDGATWKYKKCIDKSIGTSYPDADVFGDVIYLSYDKGREHEREILFCKFMENDIIKNSDIQIKIISKPQRSVNRNEVIEKIKIEKFIAICKNMSDDGFLPAAKELYNSGKRIFLIPFYKSGEISDEAVADKIKLLSEYFGEKIVIGAGNVLTKNQVYLTKISGGSFVMSPITNEKIVREAYRVGLISVAGAYTPTEIENALSYKADMISICPETSPENFEKIKFLFPDTSFILPCTDADKNPGFDVK